MAVVILRRAFTSYERRLGVYIDQSLLYLLGKTRNTVKPVALHAVRA